MSEAEIASERPKVNRKTIPGSAMTNCFPFTKGRPENLSTVINQRKRFSDKVVFQGCGVNWRCGYRVVPSRGSSIEGAAFAGKARQGDV